MAIAKISKGRSFGGILDYAFIQQHRHGPANENESTHERDRRREEELRRALDGENLNEQDRASTDLNEDLHAPRARKRRRKRRDRNSTAIRGEIIATNMAGRNHLELRHEFAAFKRLRPRVTRAVGHCSISTPKEDQVTPEAQGRMAERFAKLMRLTKTAWVAIRHKEHDHDEFHFIYSLIDHRGRLISDSKDYERAENAMRQIEVEFDLTRVAPSRESMRRSMTQAEMKVFRRTGLKSKRMCFQERVDSVLDSLITAPELIKRLEREGLEITLYRDKTGKVKGWTLTLGNETMRGSDLGRGYSWAGLQKCWSNQEYRKGSMSYERQRDDANLSRTRSLYIEGCRVDRPGEPERSREDARINPVATGRDPSDIGTNKQTVHATGDHAGRVEVRAKGAGEIGDGNPSFANDHRGESARTDQQSKTSVEAERSRTDPHRESGGEPTRYGEPALGNDGDEHLHYGRVRLSDAKPVERPGGLGGRASTVRDAENQSIIPSSADFNEDAAYNHRGGGTHGRERRRIDIWEDRLGHQFASGRASDQPVIHRNEAMRGGFADAPLPCEQNTIRASGGFPREAQVRDEVGREGWSRKSAEPGQPFEEPEVIDRQPPEPVGTQLDFNFVKTFEIELGSPRFTAGLLYGEELTMSVRIAKKERETNEHLNEERRELNSLLCDRIAAQEEHRAQYGGESVAILSKEQRQFIEDNLNAIYFGDLREGIQDALALAVVIGESPADHPLEYETGDEPKRERVRSLIDDGKVR